MFTLIAMGTGVAWLYSVVATLAPELFPTAMRGPDGAVAVYFRGRRGDHGSRTAWPGAGAEGARDHPRRYPRTPGDRAKDRPEQRPGRLRGGETARTSTEERLVGQE